MLPWDKQGPVEAGARDIHRYCLCLCFYSLHLSATISPFFSVYLCLSPPLPFSTIFFYLTHLFPFLFHLFTFLSLPFYTFFSMTIPFIPVPLSVSSSDHLSPSLPSSFTPPPSRPLVPFDHLNRPPWNHDRKNNKGGKRKKNTDICVKRNPLSPLKNSLNVFPTPLISYFLFPSSIALFSKPQQRLPPTPPSPFLPTSPVFS